MTGDARFEDGGERPLAIKAMDAEDLAVLSALAQDAVFPASEISWVARQHRFALLLNRFRWEDRDAAAARGRPVERVQSVLLFENVLGVASSGFDRRDTAICSLLSVAWQPGDDGAGRVILTLAGDGEIALQVEALEAVLKDVTRPYLAPSGHAPAHQD